MGLRRTLSGRLVNILAIVAIAFTGCSEGGSGAAAPGDTLSVTATSLAPAAADRGTDVAMLKLLMTVSGPQDNAATWTEIRVTRTGQGGNASIDNVIVALDDGDGVWEGLSADPAVGSTGTWGADNTARVSVAPQTVTAGSPKTYFVIFGIYYGAAAGDDVAAALAGAVSIAASGGDAVQLAATASVPTGITLPVPPAGTFIRTADMGVARGYQTATLLPDGSVLVAGGRDDGGAETATAELYDPARGVFAPASNAMSLGRKFHTATLLADNTVLVAGGNDGSGGISGVTDSADRFDRATSSFRSSGRMNARRQDHTAARLLDGKVLVSGGYNGARTVDTAELYAPTTDNFTYTGVMSHTRKFHTATLLPDGRVLVAGGDNGATIDASAELYDPTTGLFSPTGSMGTARTYHTATLLGDNTVLVTGGRGPGGATLASAEVYDPATGEFSPTSAPLSEGRAFHAAVLLATGKALVCGGYRGGDLATAEIYDPASRTFTATDNLVSKRDYHTATLLPDGTVLVTGGFVQSDSVSSAELYYP